MIHIKGSLHLNRIVHFFTHRPSFSAMLRLQTADCANTEMNEKSKLGTGREFCWNHLCP